MILNSPYITGSLTVTGNTTLMGALTVTGSLSGTAATASFALTLQGTGSVGFATTGAFSATSGSASSRLTQIEQVYATTGSNSFRATQSITGSLTVTGQITAQTLNVQQVTSSIVFSSGSNTFGCDLNSRQTFTGSVLMTGSLTVNTTGVEFQVTNTGINFGNALTDTHNISGSLRITGSVNHYIMGCNLGIGNASPTVRLQVSGTIATGDNVNGWGRLSFDAASNTTRLQSSKDGTDSVGLSFWTQASGGGFAERMIISGSNVGIGTSSPSYGIDLLSNNSARFKGSNNYMTLLLDNSNSSVGGGGTYFLKNGTIGGGIGSSGWWNGDDSNDLLLVATSCKNIRFHTNDSSVERMRIACNGVVRIGTCAISTNANANVALQVAGAIRFGNPDGEYVQSYGGGVSARSLNAMSPGASTIIIKGLGGSGFLYQVFGFTGTGKRFTDLLLGVNNIITVVASTTESGPASRCYTITSENLNLCLSGAETYNIVSHGFGAVER